MVLYAQLDTREKVNVVWFKRDLRLTDHEPLRVALEDGLPLLMVYIFEPSLLNAPYSDNRHWRFVSESLDDINNRLLPYHSKIHVFHGEVKDVFSALLQYYDIKNVYSHQETGTWLTFQRDIQIKKFLKDVGIKWKEFQNNAVIRGLQNRENWEARRLEFLSAPLQNPPLERIKSIEIKTDILQMFSANRFIETLGSNNKMQKGGETEALDVLNSFLRSRHKGYLRNISKPNESRQHCSRLSPYLSWGNLSVRQVYHAVRNHYSKTSNKRDLQAFESRLAWHCHFIQKFETEAEYEFKNINAAFDNIRLARNDKYLNAWKEGLTGYPLVDACMRCVKETGYINFRMRAMLISFLTHHLWLDWREGADFLARQFLDFEPGIHFPQVQMQAGTTGINTIRIYNPVKQAMENDSQAEFIKEWVPELSNLPPSLAIQPWKITPMEEAIYNFKYGVDYPQRIVDCEETYRHASKILWDIKKSEESKIEANKILQRHVKSR